MISIYFGYIPSIYFFLVIPIAIFIVALTAGGLGLLMASFNVKYRDVRYILPFFIQLLLFLTPVIYPLSIVSSTSRLLLSLNPLTVVVEVVRQLLEGEYLFDFLSIGIGIVSMMIIFSLGIIYFNRTERYFADIV